jgi:proteasome assembly chaperone (PAC2) family protein
VAWRHEIGGVACGVIDFLDKNLNLEMVGEIRLQQFFSFAGVTVADDIVQFPQSRFYSCREGNILIFRGDVPNREPYDFSNAILDFAVYHCDAQEVYTIGGFVSAMTHLSPRRIFGSVTQPELRMFLSPYNVSTDVDYQTPPQGARPSLSHFLLWTAKRREIPGYSLWVEVPFYLAGFRDLMAIRSILEVLDKRFVLGLDLKELNNEIDKMNAGIEALKSQNPEVNRYLRLMDQGIAISHEEGEILVREVARFLRKNN